MSTINQAGGNTEAGKPRRLLSLDALRGFDMFWIICGEGIFHGWANWVMANHSLSRDPTNWKIEVNGNLAWWEKVMVGMSNQLHHTPWNGFTFYDMIFPLFIFIAGVSMPYSYSNQLEKTGINRTVVKNYIYRSLIKRTLILILLGIVVNNGLQLVGYENTRFASVLGRIAIACFFAAIIYLNFSLKIQLVWLAVLLLGYWAAMMLMPVPGFGPGVLTPEGNLAGYIDRILLPGKLHHRGIYDPEGLFSNIPAIGTALLGIFTGQFLRWRSDKWNDLNKCAVMMGAGTGLLLLGLAWSVYFPINKDMWTSSFVLYAGGWSVLLLAIFYWVIDVAGFKKWSMPFVWIGMNSILIYMAAHGIFHFESSSQFLFGGVIHKVPEALQPAILWTGVMIIQLIVLNFLYRKKWFLKI